MWESGDQEEEGGGEEDIERTIDRARNRSYGDWSRDSLDSLCSIPAYEFGQENGPEGEEQGLNAVTI